MESAINYILTLTYGGKPAVVVESDIKKIYEILQDGPKHGMVFGLIDAQRAVVSRDGMVKHDRIYIDWDDAGIIVKDRYHTTIDSYYKPKPEKRRYRVRRVETWMNETFVEAGSEEEAEKIVDKMVEDGEFDVLDGWCDDNYTYAVRIQKGE